MCPAGPLALLRRRCAPTRRSSDLPALPGDPGHALWKRDFTGACGLFGVVLKAGVTDRALCAMIERHHQALERAPGRADARELRSEEHTSELQSLRQLVCRLLLDTK